MLGILKVTTTLAAMATLVMPASGQSSTFTYNPAEQWPPGGLNCYMGYRKFNPLLQKETYYVGVHAPSGVDVAMREYNMTFEAYLNRAVGDRFIPPIRFEMKPTEDPLKDWVDNEEEVDLMYSDTGLYSCVGTEIGGQALGTTLSDLTARGREYVLDVFAGTMLVRADRYDINNLDDLKDATIGALAVSDFAGAQVQFYVMKGAGLDYIMDPKQVIFTANQEEVVRGVLDGRWDVGFVRTGMVERTLDDDGNALSEDLFKVLNPSIYVMDNGDLFPFLHSTPTFPEWPFYAKKNLDRTVAEEVSVALINFEYHKNVGQDMHDCKRKLCEEAFDFQDTNETCGKEIWGICDSAPAVFFDPTARCDTTRELAELAYQAGLAGRHNGFRPARSHFELRTMQQTGGFLVQNEQGNWQCSRADTLYEAIKCPEGHYKVSKNIFDDQCQEAGLPCPEGMMCYCRPCIKAYEVDVLQWDEETISNNTKAGRVGCDKMSLCGLVEQTRSATFRAYDNREREGVKARAVMHVGQNSFDLEVSEIKPYVYEFKFSDDHLGVGILEVYVDDEQIPESPFRVEVIPKDCDVEYPGKGRVPTEDGTCECGSGTVSIGGECLETAIFATIVAIFCLLVIMEIAYLYMRYRRAKSDEMWQVSVEELHFSQPVEVIGQGSFGVVLLAEYRGTKVAIKRVLPLNEKKPPSGSKSGSMKKSGSDHADSCGMETPSVDSEPPPPPKPARKGGKGSTNIKGTDSYDPYKSTGSAGSRSGSAGHATGIGSMSADEDEDLDFLGGLSFGGPRNKWARRLPWLFGNDEQRYNASILGTASGTQGNSTKTVKAMLCPWCDDNVRRQNEFTEEMRLLSRLRHPCITTVMGAVMSRGHEPMMVMEYMENGSLYDLLRNETLYTGGEIIMQIVRDVAQGLRFLHASKPPILHGDLKAKNILIDSRFRAKVADFGLSAKKNGLSGTPFWMAPEYLRGKSEYNACCDVYSFGIIMYEIYGRKTPYEGEHPRKVLRKVCDPRINFRPPVPPTCPPKMVDVMTKCWSQDPFFRPQSKDLDLLFMDMNPQDAEPIVDEMTMRVRTQKATGDMLYQVFPKKVADKLKAGQKVEPENHENVTIFFSDIVHFTNISRMMSPVKVCHMLDRLYLAFDALARKHEVFKVETIGDAWMGVTNLDNTMDDTHVKKIAEFAVDAVQAAAKILIDADDPSKGYVRIRVGFHSGPVVSNVIGSLNPRYGLFGDTVNTASRMESNSYSQKIHCSDASAELLKIQAPEMPLSKRGKIAVKGKGNMTTYWVGEGLFTVDADGSCSKTFDDNPTVSFADGEKDKSENKGKVAPVKM